MAATTFPATPFTLSAEQDLQTSSLVSFGNYLFDRYNVKVHSDEGFNVPLYNRQVSDADIQNWQVGQQVQSKLPSAHQIGAKVQLQFGDQATLADCEVIKVHFSDSKVLYDIEVTGDFPPAHKEQGYDKWHTRLYNVDSAFVSPTTSTI